MGSLDNFKKRFYHMHFIYVVYTLGYIQGDHNNTLNFMHL